MRISPSKESGVRSILLSTSGAVRYWLSAVVHVVFPPECVQCGEALNEEDAVGDLQWGGLGFCPRCTRRVFWIRPPFCTLCGKPFFSPAVWPRLCGDCLLSTPSFDSARAIMVYEDSVIPLFHRMKYGSRSSYARFFGEIMARVYETDLSRLNLDGIIPIPLHTRRLGQRGFNQASLMAKRVGRSVGLPVHDGFLLRTRWTEPQVGLSKAERAQNVRGAFDAPQPSRIKSGRWLLVDDVFTTGSTLGEAARVLRKAGASEIHVLTAARVV